MRMIWGVVFGAVVGGVLAGAGGLRIASAEEPERYEYKVLWVRGLNPLEGVALVTGPKLKTNMETAINAAAAEGWRVSSTMPVGDPGSSSWAVYVTLERQVAGVR